jgi:uncharacterized LabA/DUF88 family protein
MKTLVLYDGQNLYHLARDAWAPHPHVSGSPYGYPAYDVEKLATALVNRKPGRQLSEIRFYTGIPDPWRGASEAFWQGFWNNKLRYLGSRGIYVYRGRVKNGQEKGVDVTIAVDLIERTYKRQYDVAIIVSQDFDFGSAIRLAKEIAHGQGRKLTFESAFPYSATAVRRMSARGIPGTEWVHIDKVTYDACIDPTDYRA